MNRTVVPVVRLMLRARSKRGPSADCAEKLDWSYVVGRPEWRVFAVFADGTERCIAYVKRADRMGCIRQLVFAWLYRLERSGGLHGLADNTGGFDHPYLAVCP